MTEIREIYPSDAVYNRRRTIASRENSKAVLIQVPPSVKLSNRRCGGRSAVVGADRLES
jgi:hypothetical protein